MPHHVEQRIECFRRQLNRLTVFTFEQQTPGSIQSEVAELKNGQVRVVQMASQDLSENFRGYSKDF
jgi:hypothetical protein